MSARSGMADVISALRGLTDAGTADYTLGTVVFWDDVQLQLVLDRHRVDVAHELLEARPTYGAGGSVTWQEYRASRGNFEATSGGTAIFFVEDATGANAGTALWSVDYANGIVTFLADTSGSAYFLTGRSFDLNGAAADVWRTKAGQAAKLFNFSTDNHSISRAQVHEHCLEMANYYASLGESSVTTLYRSDNL